MASAVVKIKTAVDTNPLVQANREVEGLTKSLKKLATAGWVGAVVAVTKKAAEALNACKKAYLEAEGAGSKYAKASDEMAKSTERLKKAIGGSLIAGNSGGMLISLTNAINKVAQSIENSNKQKTLKEEMESASYGKNKTADQLWDDFLTAAKTKIGAEKALEEAQTSGTLLSEDDYKKLQQAIDEATKAMDRVGALYKAAADQLVDTLDPQRAKTKSPTTKEEYLKLFTSSGSEAFLLQEKQKLEAAKNQQAAYEILLNSKRTKADADAYLVKTNTLFQDLVTKRDNYMREAEQLTTNTARGAAAAELAEQFQTAINIMNSNLLNSLPEKIEEKIISANEYVYDDSWFGRLEEARKKAEEEEKEKEEKRNKASSIFSNFGDLGTIINSIISSNFFTLIIQFISKIVQRANEISPNFNKLLNVFDVLVTALDPLFMVIDKILDPILEFLKSIYLTIYFISSFIKAIFTTIVSGIKYIVAAITFDKKGKASAKSEIETAWQALSGANLQAVLNSAFSSSYGSSSSGSSGGSASYTAARDIYVTINYNNSYVNGDARQIAINLRNEIRTAEAMGY